MLSGHSFNALLKTLEEPPPHVKFLLATTDPQKLPVTILSRCLQFNLRRISVERIQAHLQLILEKEQLSFETTALFQLARAADGSMRDALSLLDQAIAFANGNVNDSDVRLMLGSIEQHYVYDLLDALALADGRVLIQRVQELAQQAPDFSAVLAEIITCLHYLALLKQVPDAYDHTMGEQERLLKLGNALTAEDIQLYYQIALNGRRDLPLAPDPRNGLEMVLLRMLAFRPEEDSHKNVTAKKVSQPVQTEAAPKTESRGHTHTAATENPAREKIVEETPVKYQPDLNDQTVLAAVPLKTNASGKINLTDLSIDNWHEAVSALDAVGILKQLVEHSAFVSVTNTNLLLAVAPSHAAMLTSDREKQLQDKLSSYFDMDIKLQIEKTQIQTETPAARSGRQQQERQTEAEQSILNDDNVKNIMESFNAQVDLNSVQPR
jgi:DNA polymerase-3 subunit gamma/tau